MKTLSQALRIKHWIKNSFVFIPSFFARKLFSFDEIYVLAGGFLAMSLFASTVYLLNDIRDIEKDKRHPKKKDRPFASGKLQPFHGYLMMAICFSLATWLGYNLSADFLSLCLTYLLINIWYSFGLKNISILDILIVSSGFIFRIYMGGTISQVNVSPWLCVMVFLLSLFMALAKRLDDVRLYEEEKIIVRKNAAEYSVELIKSCLTMIGGVIVVAYILYCVSPEITAQWHSEYIFLTTIFVIAGIMRYLQLTLVHKNTWSPVQVIFTDKFIIVTIILWLLSFGAIIYI